METFPACLCCKNGPDGSGHCTHREGSLSIQHCVLPEGHLSTRPHYYAWQDESVEQTHVFSSGAKSSGKLPRYDMIPWSVFADRLAARYELGLKKYSEDNWRTGLSEREYVLDRANHALKHLHLAVEAIRTGKRLDEDDDLAAAMWGVVFLMAAQEVRQEAVNLGDICAECGALRYLHVEMSSAGRAGLTVKGSIWHSFKSK